MELRLQKLQKKLAALSCDALLITDPVNRRYLTGFTGSHGVLLLTKNDVLFLTDFRYITQAKKEIGFASFLQQKSTNILEDVVKECRRRKIKRLGFESESLTFSKVRFLKDFSKDFALVLEPTSGLVEEMRAIKSKEEIEIIRQAVRIADETFDEIITMLNPGVTEKEIALKIEVILREKGATSSAFDIIVASGFRSSLPHGVASDKRLAKGDFVTLDFGAYFQGYNSDITRTVVISPVSSLQKNIYEIVLEANKKAIAGICQNKACKDVDFLARNFIEEKGYGKNFGHGTGHGLGMNVHEKPRLSYNSRDVLKEGMVVTVEPGIYLQDYFGVRIEDDVLVTKDGYEVLTKSTKELIIL